MKSIYNTLALLSITVTVVVQVNAREDSSRKPVLEETVVLAQKRESILQETPVAITMLSGEQLIVDGINDLRAAQMYVPGVRFQAEGNNTQVFIRGVGSNLDFPNVEASVGFILNGLYIPREGTSAAFFDLAQLEVLPGPQGTLYGRSSIGGNIVATFNRPEQNTDGIVVLEAGNYEMGHVSFAQNVPITDALALRVATDYIRNDGINATGAGAKDDLGVRLSLSYMPSDDLDIYVWGQAADKNGHPQNLVNKGLNASTLEYSEYSFLRGDAWNDKRTGSLEPFAPFGQPKAEKQKYTSYIFGAQIDWQLGDKLLTYIPGYLDLESDPYYWIGAILGNLPAKFKQQSHELRLSGEDGEFKWMGGLYLYEVKNKGNLRLFVGDPIEFLQTNIENNKIDNVATFGEIIYSWSDITRITLGGRYAYDERQANGLAPDPLGSQPWRFKKDYTKFDFKLGLDHDLTDNILVYGGIQTGSKPGTYNEVPEDTGFEVEVDPTDLIAYTLGAKSTLLEGQMNLNVEAFYYDYKDLAIQAYDVGVPFNPQFSAKKVEIYGAQADLVWLAGEKSKIDASIGYTHARNKDFVTPAGDDFSGLQTPYSPDWTALLGYEYSIPMESGSLVASIRARYESSWFADYAHNPGVKQPSSWKEDISLTYEADSDWTVGLWANNVTDEAVIAATAAQGIPGPATAYLEDPFMFGIRGSYRY